MGIIEGVVQAISKKLTKTGGFKYGVRIGEGWFNSFREPPCKKGDTVIIQYSDDEWKNIQNISVKEQAPSLTNEQSPIEEYVTAASKYGAEEYVTAEQPNPVRPTVSSPVAVKPSLVGKDGEIRRMSALKSAIELMTSEGYELKATPDGTIELAKRYVRFIEKGE